MSPGTSTAYHLPATISVTDVSPYSLPVIRFDDKQIKVARHIAAARQLSSDCYENQSTWGEQSAHEAHTTGVLGEWAVREVLDQDRNEIIYALGDPGWDLKIKGYRADVKSTAADAGWYPDLLVSADQELRADLYVLAHRDEPNKVRVIGYCTTDSVRNRRPKRLPEGRRAYVVPADDLRLLPEV